MAMELVSMKCPQCMGNVLPFGDGSKGRCECCDGVFALGGSKTQQDDVEDFEDEEDGEDLDLEEFFDSFSEELDDDSSYEFFVGPSLASSKGRSKVKGARKNFDVDDDEEIYLVLDTTIFGNCKVGLACCDSGMYMKDEDGDLGYIAWEDFIDVELDLDGGTLTIDGYPFISTPTDADLLFDLFDDLQEAL